jgi:hypothetical protein
MMRVMSLSDRCCDAIFDFDGWIFFMSSSLGRAIINQSRLDFNQDSKESKEKRNDELATFF